MPFIVVPMESKFGYGLRPVGEPQAYDYATEAKDAAVNWAMQSPGTRVDAVGVFYSHQDAWADEPFYTAEVDHEV